MVILTEEGVPELTNITSTLLLKKRMMLMQEVLFLKVCLIIFKVERQYSVCTSVNVLSESIMEYIIIRMLTN